MRECVKIIAIKIGKWTTENANLMKSLENTKEQLERSIKIHHTWVEQYNAEKRGFEEAKRQLHLITEKHDELKKKIKTHEKRAQHQREMDEKVGCLARKLSDTKRKFGEKLEGLREELRLSREAEKRAVRRSEDDQAQLADIRKQLSNCSLKLQSAQNALNTQMKLSNNKVALAIQRARKGEVMLLQLKLDIGVRVLDEALSDTERNICELEMKRNTYFLVFCVTCYCTDVGNFLWKVKRRVLIEG
ncbi:unnamed protein product [Toxocara canis]|uniref:Coiled-coil domain-containing protein 176 n=1 Tax=Toxocara canis TaxID=6265 RepID=A0A183V4K5_TOXCA|nr:unnamed protein product [Toxocara canis]